MSYELIIVEKPSACKKIAEALADSKPKNLGGKGVVTLSLTHNGKEIRIACAVGHLYTLKDKEKGWNYPVFDIEWIESHKVRKDAAFTKKYLTAIRKLVKGANEFTVSTDYDIEGEVIGLNIIKYLCKQKDANRMKFSALTKSDIVEAYNNKAKTLDWGQAKAGETRHYLDYYYGINISRALTSAIKDAGTFKILSTGRVQGPALKIIVDRELDIRNFKPTPYWQIELHYHKKSQDRILIGLHKTEKFWKEDEAKKAYDAVKNQKNALINKVSKRKFNQAPPNPFDLTTLQLEAYRALRISPKDTLAISQDLYLAGVISYPRTSSQQLPPNLNYKKIFNSLAKQESYNELVKELLKKNIKPNNGRKTDPAHPAIHPTGEFPKGLTEKQAKLYDLIVRRTLATFSESAERETMTIEVDCNNEIFLTKGTRTIYRGWHKFYEPYLNFKEEDLPDFDEKEDVNVKKANYLSKETEPPKRYTPASIIKELESKNLGTKATRSAIIDTLFNRGYVHGQSIEATKLGIDTIQTLEEYMPKIVDEELTRHFEIEMEEIRKNKKNEKDVLKEAQKVLTEILNEFKDNKLKIGEKLKEANIEAREETSKLGPCPVCNTGTLQLKRGKYGFFAACSKEECKNTISLPSNALIKPSKKICNHCNAPMVLVIRKGKKPQELCIDKHCKSKHIDEQVWKDAKEASEEKECPKCKKGKLILRKSMYGTFWGCSAFPKCKYTEKLKG